MELANWEAGRFNHKHLGSEHILLALVQEGTGVAIKVVRNLGIDPRQLRLECESLLVSGPDMVIIGKLPRTPRANKLIELSIEEGYNLNHNFVGTEHILLGLLRDGDGVAGVALRNLGLSLEGARNEVLEIYGTAFGGSEHRGVASERSLSWRLGRFLASVLHRVKGWE